MTSFKFIPIISVESFLLQCTFFPIVLGASSELNSITLVKKGSSIVVLSIFNIGVLFDVEIFFELFIIGGAY